MTSDDQRVPGGDHAMTTNPRPDADETSGVPEETSVVQDETSVLPEPSAAPTAPIPVATRGTSRARWVAALAVTVIVVAAAVGATALLTGASPASEVLAWTPSNSVLYAEARLDLPGDQRQQLGRFLSAFPGFDDQAILDQKLGEVMDRVVQSASEGAYDYRTNIDPWFDGQLSMSIGPLPPASDVEGEARALVVLGVDDAAAARAWVGEFLADEGTTGTTAHGGVEITTVTPPADSVSGAVTGAYATFGPVLALGDLESVKAAIDTNGSGGLANADEFRTAARSIEGDHLAFWFMDTDAFTEWSTTTAGDPATDDVIPMPSLPAFVEDLSPAWMAGAVRAEDGRLVLEARTPHQAAIAGDPANRASSLAALVPADTLVLAASHDVADTLDRALTLLRSDPSMSEGVAEVESALGILGGIEGIAGWIGDLGVVIVPEGEGIAGGVVIDPTDRAAADRLLTTLRSFVTLAGGSAGITLRDETHGSATVTILTIEDAGALLELAGGMTGGGASVPPGAPVERVELAWTVTDDVVVLGSSPSFVRTILDTAGGDSLAENGRFAALVDAAGRDHSGLFWLDVTGARSRLEATVPPEDRAEYDADIRPYLGHLDAVLGVNVAGAEVDATTILVTVSE